MNIDVAELEKLAAVLREISPLVKDVTRMLELMKELGMKGNSVVVPPVTERLLQRNDVIKILKVGSAAIATLIKNGQLTPLYIADSTSAKFRLSEVMKLLEAKEE